MDDRRRNRDLHHLHPWHGIGPRCCSLAIVIVGAVAVVTFAATVLQRLGA